MILLEQGRMRAELAPSVGGGLARLTFGARDILRPAPSGSRDVLEMACFPLVPYTNRIAGARFRFEGRDIVLAKTDGGHALHGDGWRGCWRVVEQARDAAILLFEHERRD